MLQRFLCAGLLASALCMPAAEPKTVIVTASALDSYTQLPIANARISVSDTAGVMLLDSLSMRVIDWNYRQAFSDIDYRGTVPAHPLYHINISAKGYAPQEFTASANEHGNLFLGSIYMRRPHKEMKLNEVTVTATRVKMVMKGDTIEYDASAFQLPDGSMLDALIAALPGATLSNDGRISVNGRFISELLINGRSFFNGDPQIALRNLPAYTVKNVQVYQKTPQDFIGFDNSRRDRKADPLVMDVNLKPLYWNGWLANAEGGFGSTLNEFRNRWMGRLFAMRYNKFSYVALQASANNLNDPAKAGTKGQWQKASASDGLRTTKRASLEYNTDWHDQGGNGINTFIDVERSRRVNGFTRLSEQYLTGGNVFTKSNDASSAEDWTARWRGEISRRKDKLGRVWFATSVDYLKGSDSGSATDEQWTSAPVYLSSQASDTDRRRFRNDWRLILSGYFVNNYNLSLQGDGFYENETEDNLLRYQITYPSGQPSDIFQQQHSVMPTRRWDYKFYPNFSTYGLPLGKSNINIKFNYIFRHMFNSGRRTLSEINGPADASAPSVAGSSAWQLNEANSYHTVRRTLEHTFYADITFNFKNNFNIDITLKPVFDSRTITDHRDGNDRRLHRNSWLRIGRLNIGRSKDWMNCYGLATSINESGPDLMQMLDVIDNSNPLLITLGNPNLKTSTQLNFSAYYRQETRNGLGNFNLHINYTKFFNTFGMATSYDRTTGIRTTRPDNINGNWRINGSFHYSATFLPGQKLSVNNNFTPELNHSVDFASDGFNPSLSAVRRLHFADDINAKWEFLQGTYLTAKVTFSWSRMNSLSQLFEPFSFIDSNYGIGFSGTLLWGISIDTDLALYCRRGFADTSLNTTDWVWNLQLSKSFGPSRQFTLKVIGFDILQQLPSVRQVINAQGRTETRYNSQPAYALLTLAYRFDLKPGR